MSKSITNFFKPSRLNQERGSALPHDYAWSAIKGIKKLEEDTERIGSKRDNCGIISVISVIIQQSQSSKNSSMSKPINSNMEIICEMFIQFFYPLGTPTVHPC